MFKNEQNGVTKIKNLIQDIVWSKLLSNFTEKQDRNTDY